PGRPSHKDRGVRNNTSTSTSAQLSGLLAPETPPRKLKQSTKANKGTAFLPHTNSLLAFTTGLPIHLQASPERSRGTDQSHRSTSKKSGKPRVGLNTLKHRTDKGWTSAGRATTVTAYKCFEQWKNDYSPQHYGLAECVDIVHAGNPFDRPKDI
ncbi:hypothetical protein B0H11DRAFT_1665632, partial [Mycena galericulata]